MADLPFDAVIVQQDAERIRLTAGEFMSLPLPERVQIILERRIEFRKGPLSVDRSVGLQSLMGK
jgi:hypothetical protein